MKPVSRTCPVCGRKYKADPARLRHGRQTTCGRACSYQLRATDKANRRQIVCSACGEQFERPASQIKSKHKGIYCSRECHYRGRTTGLTARVVTSPYVLVANVDRKAASAKAWANRRASGTDRHSEATRERLRQATLRQIAAAQGGHNVSKVEDEVAKELTRRGVSFVRQFGVRDPATGRYVACVDFLIDGRCALEVNGTFWHADPRAFPNGPAFSSQRRTLSRYARKVAALGRLGIPLAEVWEADIDKGLENAVGRSLATLGV